jgi:small subunit ribosomal protein S5
MFCKRSLISTSKKSSGLATPGENDLADFEAELAELTSHTLPEEMTQEEEDAFLDKLLIGNFDRDMQNAGSTGISDYEANTGFGEDENRRKTCRYLMEDYVHTFSTSSKVTRSAVTEPASLGDGIIEAADMVNVRAARQPWFELNTASEEVTTPDMWFGTFMTPREKNQWIMRHLTTSRVSNMTAKGKTPSLKSMIVIGNGQGSAGYGVGKGKSLSEANNRAIVNAKNNLIYVDLKDGRGLYEPLQGRHNNTRAFFWPRPHDAGHKVGDIMRAVCECFGLMDVSGRIVGRNNPYSVIQAIFKCFHNFRTLEEASMARGRRLFDLQNMNPQYTRDPFN